MNLFKKTVILLQTLAFVAFLPTLSMARSWVDNVEISKDFEKLYFTQTRSAGGGTKTYIHIQTPSTKNVAFSKDSGPGRQTLFLFTDTGKKYVSGRHSYYLFRFENTLTKTARCFYIDKDPFEQSFGFDIKISEKDFYPKACKVAEGVASENGDKHDDKDIAKDDDKHDDKDIAKDDDKDDDKDVAKDDDKDDDKDVAKDDDKDGDKNVLGYAPCIEVEGYYCDM